MPTNHPKGPIGLELEGADRRVLITACCIQLWNHGFRDLSLWREKAGYLDWYSLLAKAEELGVELRLAGKPYHLPEIIRHR